MTEDQRPKKGDDTMSAYARDFVFIITKEEAERISKPTISKERMEQIKKNAAKYLQKQDEKTD